MRKWRIKNPPKPPTEEQLQKKAARHAASIEKRKLYMLEYHAKNKNRERDKRRARYKANPEKYITRQRRYYYGVTAEQTSGLLAAQGNCCAICKTDKPLGRGIWHLDHDHTTKTVRGFLCHHCNVGLGFFKDNPLKLEAAANYLRRHGST